MVVDDQPMVRAGVRVVLADRFAIEEVASGELALKLLTTIGDFDVAVVDLRGSRDDALSGPATIRAMHEAQPGLGIVAHGVRVEGHVVSEALAAGATAYVCKSSEPAALTQGVEAAAAAQRFIDPAAARAERPALSRRQREILQHYANGASTTEVARRLGLVPETVRTHTKKALKGLEAEHRAHAVAIALRGSLID